MTAKDFKVCAQICADLIQTTKGRVMPHVILNQFTCILSKHHPRFDQMGFTIEVNNILQGYTE